MILDMQLTAAERFSLEQVVSVHVFLNVERTL